jgi:prepilin-type N-terminal cleavage/methylation domain-containing protein/prepilin-type processing-associated H-X9-DG protein
MANNQQIMIRKRQAYFLRGVISTSRQGFTLVELLVVISIIALLLAILMPSLSKAKGQAVILQCKTKEKQLHLAACMYADDNGDRFPLVSNWTGFLISNPGETLKRYLNGVDHKSPLWKCPGDKGLGYWVKYWETPTEFIRSYSINTNLTVWLSPKVPAPPKRLAIKTAGSTILWSENWSGWASWHSNGFTSGCTYDYTQQWGKNAVLHSRSSKANYTFVDGHTEYLDWLKVSPADRQGEGMYKVK